MANKNSCVFVNICDATRKEGKQSVVVLTWKTHRLCRMGIIRRVSSWIKCMSKVIFWVCCFSIASRVIWHIAWRYYFVSYLITFFYFILILLRTWVCQTILVFLVSSRELTLESQEVHQKRLLEEPFRELPQSTNQPW